MKRNLFSALTVPALAIFAFAAPSAYAAECDPGKPGDALTEAEVQKVYDCFKGKLHKGYKQGKKGWVPKRIVDDYPKWVRVSTFPAAPGVHGDRFLVTYVNKAGAKTYMKYSEHGVTMPPGSAIAKESFSITKKGKVRPGPLFIMQKAPKGKSPKTLDWYYMAVSPKGQPMAIDVYKACNECHVGNYRDRDGLGYPVEEARVK